MLNYLNKWWIRWISILILAMLLRFGLDVAFGLMYRNYSLVQPFQAYFFAFLLSFLTLESFYQLKKKMDSTLAWELNPKKRFLFQWLVLFGISFFFFMIVRYLYLWVSKEFTFIALIDEVIILCIILLVVSTMTIVEFGIFLLEKWQFSLAEIERFKKESAEFQFESLRSQVNPHFLFNSLNTLSSLMYENLGKAELFIRELSDVYRYILENRGQELVELKRELEVAKSYIYLMRLRFDQNLIINLEIDNQAEQKMIAPLTLQLLIENAIKHNVISKKKPLKIDILADSKLLEVKNNLQKKESREYSSEMGLKNIQSRYGFLTSEKILVEENLNEFKVVIPLIDAL